VCSHRNWIGLKGRARDSRIVTRTADRTEFTDTISRQSHSSRIRRDFFTQHSCIHAILTSGCITCGTSRAASSDLTSSSSCARAPIEVDAAASRWSAFAELSPAMIVMYVHILRLH
jgi:hypothetical protein